ncbi:hypothetical protein ACFR9U_18150 [Halorientalis brevis]|uniref:Uncharacterized protein n=1 Tax=Halorientalis brevis TaxID=1126241 RepID=A0ABD6CHV6_9EURY|nr:hypothetical protein [Halorientalis brevis]
MGTAGLGRIVRDHRNNAILSWLLVGLVGVASVGSLATDLLWTVFTAAVVLIAVFPALSVRNVWTMPPWEVVLLATLPTIGRLFATTLVTGRIATYLSVAALALLVAVDLNAFTPVEMSDGFAVLFVVIATMATAGIWAVVRWGADLVLGTGFLTSERALMLEFVASTIAGVLAGVVFVFYFRRFAQPERRVPEEVRLP